jgi:DNA-directed RNA polymerase subunit K/omega
MTTTCEAFSTRNPDQWLPAFLVRDDTSSAINYANTTPLTKYERATVIGHRALQIAQNSRARVVCASENPLDVAKEELLAKSLPPMSVGRYLPDGSLIRKTVQEVYRPMR